MCAEVYSQRRVDAEAYKNIDACPALELPSTGSDEEQQSKTFYFLFIFICRHFAEDAGRQISYLCDVNPYREGSNLCYSRTLTGKSWRRKIHHQLAL